MAPLSHSAFSLCLSWHLTFWFMCLYQCVFVCVCVCVLPVFLACLFASLSFSHPLTLSHPLPLTLSPSLPPPSLSPFVVSGITSTDRVFQLMCILEWILQLRCVTATQSPPTLARSHIKPTQLSALRTLMTHWGHTRSHSHAKTLFLLPSSFTAVSLQSICEGAVVRTRALPRAPARSSLPSPL